MSVVKEHQNKNSSDGKLILYRRHLILLHKCAVGMSPFCPILPKIYSTYITTIIVLHPLKFYNPLRSL